MHGIRKLKYYEDDLLIYVMDTRKLPTSRIRRSTDLLKSHNVSWAPNLTDYSLGEYLIHGKLEHSPGLWQAVKFEKLISAGFWEAFPSWQQDRYLLAIRVAYLRTVHHRRSWPCLTDNLTKLMSIAKCFGEQWDGIMWIALISLRCRDLTDHNLEAVETMLELTSVPQLPWSTSPSLRSFHITLGRVPEAQHFLRILRLLHDRQQARIQEKDVAAIHVEVHELLDGDLSETWDEEPVGVEEDGQ